MKLPVETLSLLYQTQRSIFDLPHDALTSVTLSFFSSIVI